MSEEFDHVRAGDCAVTRRRLVTAFARQCIALFFLLVAMPWVAAAEQATGCRTKCA